MKEMLWKLLAKILGIPFVASWLIKRAMRTPYFHLEGYMNRYWLFNRYSAVGKPDVIPRRFSWLPSVRIHHILREDDARDLHDHPWNARTIILKGYYVERRLINKPSRFVICNTYLRQAGDTATINFGEYHNIDEVSDGGVWTLFIAGNSLGTWGFLVDGKKVPYKEYEKVQE